MKVSFGTTDLASPAIAMQHLFSQLLVWLGIKPQTRSLWSDPGQEAFSVTSCRNACRCSQGRNLKNRDMDCRSAVDPRFRGSLLPGSPHRSSPDSSPATCPSPASKLPSQSPVRPRNLGVVELEPSSRTGLLPSSPLRTVHESFPSHSSSPSNASFGETRFRDRNALVVNPVMALRMK